MTTIKKTASVKVMLSFDYCHFETSMTLEKESGINHTEIDKARKECMFLCDKAIEQYKIAKKIHEHNVKFNDEYSKRKAKGIRNKAQIDRTEYEKAFLKAFDEHEYIIYNYDDDVTIDDMDDLPF